MPQQLRRRAAHHWAIMVSMLAIFPPAVEANDPFKLTGDQERRVIELLGRMPLEQKIGQLSQLPAGALSFPESEQWQEDFDRIAKQIREGRVGSLLGMHGADMANRVQRLAVEEGPLGIPLLFGCDVIHGYRTVFPIPLAESCTWSPQWVERAARAAAVEATAAGVNWTYAPMVDIARDPRWGRIIEGSGEDPWLGAALAAARVRGFQGSDLAAPDTLLACAKHFAAYGAAEAGRDYNTVDISPRTLHEVYLPPFRAAVDAGVGSIMTSFNEINGTPATGHAQLINGVLRAKWGFEGVVISDYSSIFEMIAHGFAADQQAAAIAAITAGVDVDMVCDSYGLTLPGAIKSQRLKMDPIDRAVKRVLKSKMALGLFERPYVDAARERSEILTDAHRRLARELAHRSMVLLKNEKAALPLQAGVRLALVGPLADAQADMLGAWAPNGRAEDVVTLLAALRSRMNPDKLGYAQGCSADTDENWNPQEAVAATGDADVIVAVVGEPAALSGEAASRALLDLPGRQQKLLEQLDQTGKPLIVVVMSGRPLTITWLAEHADAILMAWHLGVEAGPAVADVLFGEVNPSGKLTATMPRTVGQIPLYYSYKNTGRPSGPDKYLSNFLDVPTTPLYVFGHGLSYTTFSYGNIKVTPAQIGPKESVTVQVTVTNTGSRPGEEVVQLYMRDLVASFTRPIRQLRGFERVSLEAGQSHNVSFTLGPKELSLLDANLEPLVEPGEFEVYVGGSSAATQSAKFTVKPE